MTTTPVSLRDRRREQTEREVASVALSLFEEHGVDGTTVDDIAREAGISPRTFFRYFATKEHAALVPHRDLEERVARMVDALAADRPLLRQLEAVWTEVFATLDREHDEAGRQLLRVRRLMCTEPTLRQTASRLDDERAHELATHLRELLGDTDDLRARVLVETSAAAARVALEEWAEATEAGRPVALLATYERCRRAQRAAT